MVIFNRCRLSIIAAAALFLLGAAPQAFAGKIDKSRKKLENSGSSRSKSSSSGSSSEDSDSESNDDCSFLGFLFGLCGWPEKEEEESLVPQPTRVSTVEPAAQETVPESQVFKGKARIEILHGKDGSDEWTQFGLDLGLGNDDGGIFVSAEGMQVKEVSEKGVTLDRAGIIPFSLGLQTGSPVHRATIGWGWAFTDGLADAEGRFWRLQYELTPDPAAYLRPLLRTGLRMIWFRDVFFYHLRADFGVIIARHLEVFAGGSRVSLEEIEWNWLHLGIGARI